MSTEEFVPFVPSSVSPKLQALLCSSEPSHQLFGLFALLRRIRPMSVEVWDAGQPMTPVQVATVMKETAQKLRAAEGKADLNKVNFGFRLKGELPKKIAIGRKLRIEVEVIDRQGNLCPLPVPSTCRLAVYPHTGAPDITHRSKRLREECLCGITEIQTTGPTVTFDQCYFTQTSRQQPEGVFTLQLECEGVSPLQLPGIRVARS